MIINPNDKEVVNCLKKWNVILKDGQEKLKTIETEFNKEAQKHKAETEMFHDEFCKLTGLPPNKAHLMTEIGLAIVSKL